MSCRTLSFWVSLVFAQAAAAVVPGDAPPAVKAKNQDDKVIDLGTMYGQRPVVLFFYPKSFTPGCTIEVQAFRDALGDLKSFDAAVFGVSQDDPGTQRKFCDSYKLSYDLLADEGGAIATAFGIPTSGRFNSRHTVVVGRSGKVALVETDVGKDIKGHPKKVTAALEKDWKAYVAGFEPLFNGKNLDGWVPVQASADTWTVKDGLLRCTGSPVGYVRTGDRHKDYRLLVEFNYAEKVGNAGVLVHINGPDKVWPKSIEPNLNAGQMGKFYVIDGATLEHGKANPLRNIDVKPGAWNRFEVICEADAIRVLLNGELVNEGKKANPSEGFIGLQSEGVPIHFRIIAYKTLSR